MISNLGCSEKQTLEVNNIEIVEEIVDTYDSLHGFSGNILISYKDSVIFQSSSGFSNYDQKISNTANTKFRLASLSKQFTAFALLLLEQKGKVDFEKPVSNYVKSLKPEIGNAITIHQILSHSSGLGRDIESLSEEELGKSYISLDSIITLINSSELQFEPGSKSAYSNLGYAIAAKIIENQMELSYGEALESLIFKPLGMNQSGHEESNRKIPNLAFGYIGLPDKVIKAAYEDKSYVIGAGSIYSTVGDLFIWSRAIMKGKLISSQSREELFKKQAGRYSYGWFIGTYVWPPVNDKNQALNLHHDGGCPGFECKLSLLIEHDIAIIVLSNKLPSNYNNLANQITNSVLGFDESPPKKDGTEYFFKVLFEQGVDSTVSLKDEWEVSNKSYLVPPTSNLFMIGRGYIDNNEYEKAHVIMDYLIKVEPKWSYPYLFKAIMLEDEGQNVQAMELYTKVLEVEPEQSNATFRLKKLKENNNQ